MDTSNPGIGLLCPLLSLSKLQALSPSRRANALRTWLQNSGFGVPPAMRLAEIINSLCTAGADRQPVVRWPGTEVRRYRDTLYAMPPLPPPPHSELLWADLKKMPALPLGSLYAVPTREAGGFLPPPHSRIQIRFRHGGETCRWGGKTRRIKKLLQESGIPPWWRDFIPLIHVDGVPAAIPGIGICDNFRSATAQNGWTLRWEIR